MKWLTQLLRWSSTLIIARLLTPTDYGLVGMAMIYLGLVQLVNEFGLSSAIVQRPLDEDQLARLGGVSAILGGILFLASAAASHVIALLFAEPRVQLVLLALSSTFLIRGLQVLPRGLLTRELKFRALAGVDAAEAATLTLATLGLALLGYGYWSLVWSSVLSALVGTLCALRLRPHRVAWPGTVSTLRDSLRFGGHVVLSRLAWYAYSNADFAVVGRVLGTAALGAYSFGWSIASIPVERVSATVGRVVLGVFSSLQRDYAAIRRYLLALTEGIALLTFPAAVGLSLVAHDFVLVVLGAKWSAAVVPLQLLSLYAAVRSIDALFPQILLATGHSRENMRFSLIAVAVLPVLFYLGSHWGTTGVALAWIVGFPLVMLPTNFRFTLRLLGVPARDFLLALWPAFSGTLVMAAAVFALRAAVSGTLPPGRRLAMEIAVGASTYAALMWFAHGRRVRAFAAFVRSTRRY